MLRPKVIDPAMSASHQQETKEIEAAMKSSKFAILVASEVSINPDGQTVSLSLTYIHHLSNTVLTKTFSMGGDYA